MTESGLPQRAFIDESFRWTHDDKGVYLLSAVTITSDVEGDVRHRLRACPPGRAKRLHWRDDSRKIRTKGLTVLADHNLNLTGLTVLTVEVNKGRQEKARQHALWSLVHTMHERDVHELVFEGRQRKQDEKDAKTLADIYRLPRLRSCCRFSVGRPLDEPLLWLPDYLAGAMGEQWIGGDHRYAELLPEELVDVIQLQPVR